jgi:tripartite motif-containing protein 71
LTKNLLVTGMVLIVCALLLAGCGAQIPATVPVVLEPTAALAPTAAPISTTAPEFASTETSQPASELDLIWEIKGNPNPFRTPTGVAVDSNGNVYIMDTENERIQKFDSAGNFITTWGSPGSGEGQFRNASSWGTLGHLATDSQGNVYVIDTNNYRVQKFDGNGNYLTQWGAQGLEEGNFRVPYDIAVDAQSNVYICECQTINRVQKFDATGKFLIAWGKKGYKDGEFSGDQCTLTVDPDGNILVADRSGRIQKFDPNGQFLSKITLESVDNILISPWNIAVDGQGNIYVGDYDHLRITKLDSEGRVLASWTGKDTDGVRFSSLLDIAVDNEGNIYISDALTNTIKKLRQS